MTNPNTNRRVAYTKKALREAYIDLMIERPLSGITVTDICARADINRSTFYLHYKDVDALLVEIESEVLHRIRQHFSCPPCQHSKEGLVSFLELMRQTPRIPKLFYALAGDQGDPRFTRRLQKLIFDAFQRGWERNMPETSPGCKMLIYSYIIPGITTVLAAWVQGDAPDMTAAQTVALLESLLLHGIESVAPLCPPPALPADAEAQT